MKKNITFLTKRNFDVKLLIQNLKKNSASITDIKDQQILKEITSLLRKDETYFLSPQEIHFLDSNDKKIWAKYLIFRYKIKYFPRKQLVYDFPIYLLIEPVSACNLRCIMCFQIDESFTSDNNFMGNMDVDFFKKKSYLYKNNETLFNQYKNANGSLIRELYLKPYTLVLTDIMRKKDSVIRYFAKSKLDKHDRIFEINKLDYNSEANFYDKVSLIWQLQGSKENILLNNTKILENAEKIFEGIEDFLDPLEFYEEEITLYEEIQEKLGRLKFPPELPTGGSGGASGY
jgi:hypothetical protein